MSPVANRPDVTSAESPSKVTFTGCTLVPTVMLSSAVSVGSSVFFAVTLYVPDCVGW